MSLEHILLALLVEPSSGYDLKKRFDGGARFYWAAELSQIYPTLKRLEERGFLTSTGAPSDKGPRRRVYTRTESGREELLGWLGRGPVMSGQRLAYLAQLEHLYEIGDLAVTREFVVQLRDHFAGFHEFLSEFEIDDTSDAGFHELLSMRHGLAVSAARVAWCDEALDLIDRRRSPKGAT